MIVQTRTRKRKTKIVSMELMKNMLEKAQAVNARAELIQMLIPLGLNAVGEELQKEVKHLAGAKHSREGVASRWGEQPGSVYLGDEKFRIEVPRLRDTDKDKEIPLQSYQSPGSPRRLDKEDILAVFVDGKSFAEDGIILVVGITLKGEKVILGFVQSATENHKVLKEFFERLVERGLGFEEGLLFVVDGSKGILKAIEDVFDGYALIQRCQWHKRENVLSYLPKNLQGEFKQKLSDAHHKPAYPEAKAALQKIRKEIAVINQSAAASLDEGLEETLTLHRLGLFEELGKSFKTTNVIESIQARIGQFTDAEPSQRDEIPAASPRGNQTRA